MIEKLRSMAIFAMVVDHGTFRAAALHLGLSPSRVSQSVSDLEKQLGVTLLYRSTRQLSLTNDGRILNVGHIGRKLVASPAYCATKPPPSHPRDLEDWEWVRFVMRPDHTELTSEDGEVTSVLGKSRVSVNSANSLYEFAVRGLGVTAIPENMARRGFDRNELVHLLPNWSLKPLGLHALWPDQSRRENLTRKFVRFLAEGTAGTA